MYFHAGDSSKVFITSLTCCEGEKPTPAFYISEETMLEIKTSEDIKDDNIDGAINVLEDILEILRKNVN